MGKPEGEDVQDLQGPIRLEDVPGYSDSNLADRCSRSTDAQAAGE